MATEEEIQKLAMVALFRSFKVHEDLGDRGKELVKKNDFGETALRIDIESELEILNVLREAKFPIRVHSEEHGITEITDNPIYLGVLDGLDGTYVYSQSRGRGRYGTMFGVFNSVDPSYDDYVFSGVMEHSTNRLFFAIKGKGSFFLEKGVIKPICCADTKILDKSARIYVDEYFEINRKVFSEKLTGFNIKYFLSSCLYYVDVASGAADLALECTRKRNLEIAVSYGLIKESGGAMVDIDGKSIGDRKYLEFGQNTNIPIITAATNDLAIQLIDHLKCQSL